MRFDIKLGKAYVNVPRPQVAEIISEINQRSQRRSYAQWIVGLALVLTVAVGFLTQESAALGVFVVGSLVALIHQRQVQKARITTLHYELDVDYQSQFESIHQAFNVLTKVEKIWLETSRQPLPERLKTAGAGHAVSFSQVAVKLGCVPPPFIHTNLVIWSLDVDYLTLFFFPDYVLLWRRGLYSAISYSAVDLSFKPIRVNLQRDIPQDAQVIGQTWLHVTPQGKPDPRIRNNPQFLQVQYGYLQMMATIGLSLRFYLSSYALAEQFTRTFQSAQSTLSRRDRAARPVAEVLQQEASAHAILGVKPNASLAEIKAAYYQMARMNHPDRVVGLDPEFRDLAERRMKMISAAYKTLLNMPQHRQPG